MMEWLTPIGFLGLLSLAILIIIYIIKSNFQKKFISSTYVWKLSLKRKKKKFEMNRFRNILILICQILILTSCAFILAQPFIAAADEINPPEKIIVLDASASMLAVQRGGVTRFETAVTKIKALTAEVLAQENAHVTLILAGYKAEVKVDRTNSPEAVNTVLNEFIEYQSDKPKACTLGLADVEGAMKLAEDILTEYSYADVIFFTAKSYTFLGNVKVETVSESEWNAAIISCDAYTEDNAYVFDVEVASYNPRNAAETYLDVYLYAKKINGDVMREIRVQGAIQCEANESAVLRFEGDGIYSFESVEISLDVKDSFGYDNKYYIYGGNRQTIIVRYYSSDPNNYIRGAFNGLIHNRRLSKYWDIDFREIALDKYEPNTADFYIFEHQMPEVLQTLPSDGVVLIIDPDRSLDPDLVFGGMIWKATPENYPFAQVQAHPIMNFINAEAINVAYYTSVLRSNDYQTLMSCNGSPTLLVKNQPSSKVAVLPFSLQYSNLPMLYLWAPLIYNIFDYFFPPTIEQFVFEVKDTVHLKARGESLTVNNFEGNTVYDVPISITADYTGTYTLTQTLMNGTPITDFFFVKIASSESDFANPIEELPNPVFPQREKMADLELLFYFALTLISLLFVERILHINKQI